MQESKPIPVQSGCDEWLTDLELTGRGFPTSEIRAAIERKELAGRLYPTAFLVQSGPLADWLNKRPSESKSAAPPPRGISANPSRRFAEDLPPSPAKGTGATRRSSSVAAHPAVEAFCAAVDAKISSGLPRPRAVRAVVAENPELHRAVVDQANANRRPHRVRVG